MSTVGCWLRADVSGPLDRELLLAFVLSCSRAALRAHPERSLTASEEQLVADLMARRAAGEPLAYLVGRREFWSLPLKVTPDVLVPRPESELVVELALSVLPSRARVLDMATGSGAIGLAIASERSDADVTLTDLSPAALSLAQENAEKLGLEVTCCPSNWFAAISQQFDIIVCNPPYVRTDDPHLETLRFEPYSALVAGCDGLDAMRVLARDAPAHLAPGGWLIVEHGFDQGGKVRELFAEAGLAEVNTHLDLADLERVTIGYRP